MGYIIQDVENNHLTRHCGERGIIKPFLSGFDVTWARRRRAYNTELSIYFLKPEHYMEETFGFDSEIMLVVSDFETLEPRSMQMAESILNDEPAKGRVSQSIYFIISKDGDSYAWTQSYLAKNPQSRTPVVFNKDEIVEKAPHDSWYIRNIIAGQLFTRDMFNYQLPIDNDMYFFGREANIASYVDSIKTCKNIGIFGLRKTGKTSVLYKVKRVFERDKLGLYIYLDSKLPSIRSLRWYELLELIIKKIKKHFSLDTNKIANERDASHVFLETLGQLTDSDLVCLVFDEIEYISPMATLDTHWAKDFIPFWQTIWSAQSQHRSLVSIIAGVNPSVTEIDTFHGVQNPMFGIVTSSYLQGLSEDDLRKMLYFFGKRMGLKFTPCATRYLTSRYGGHPLLTRLACSFVHNNVSFTNTKRPFIVNEEYFIRNEKDIEDDIQFYCRHVISEIKQFYPDEYEMLELIATGKTLDFMELSLDPDLVRHLNSYGLISTLDSRPVFAIPVVGRHIGMELARKTKSHFQKEIVSPQKRDYWLTRRLDSIIKDMRLLEKILSESNNSTPIYGDTSFVEVEKFYSIKTCNNNNDFVSFINTCNRSFVEPIDTFGRKIGKPDYFWNEIKLEYPSLWSALHRIRVYRNNDLHIKLKPKVEEALTEFLKIDLEGRRISQIEDVWFRLQQCVIDELLTGIVCEINSRN